MVHMKNRKKLIIALAALICLLIAVLGSHAYLTAETTTRNIITTGGVTIEIKEYADEDMTTPFEDVSGAMPATSVVKIVVLDNIGTSPAWVRIKVDTAVAAADGTALTADSILSLDIDSENWTYSDGWYYWNTALEPGESTTPLFRHVSFNADMQNEYQNSTAEVSVTAQAVQYANNGETVLEAQGWPGEPTGGDGV